MSRRDNYNPVAQQVAFDPTNCEVIDAENTQEAIDELCAATAISASPGYAFGRTGNNGTNDWLNMYGGDIRSHRTGIPFGLNDGEIVEVWVGNEDVSTFDISIYEHQGDSIGLALLTTVSLVAVRNQLFTVSVPVTKDRQIAARVTSGSAKNVAVFLIIKGTR